MPLTLKMSVAPELIGDELMSSIETGSEVESQEALASDD